MPWLSGSETVSIPTGGPSISQSIRLPPGELRHVSIRGVFVETLAALGLHYRDSNGDVAELVPLAHVQDASAFTRSWDGNKQIALNDSVHVSYNNPSLSTLQAYVSWKVWQPEGGN